MGVGCSMEEGKSAGTGGLGELLEHSDRAGPTESLILNEYCLNSKVYFHVEIDNA